MGAPTAVVAIVVFLPLAAHQGRPMSDGRGRPREGEPQFKSFPLIDVMHLCSPIRSRPRRNISNEWKRCDRDRGATLRFYLASEIASRPSLKSLIRSPTLLYL